MKHKENNLQEYSERIKKLRLSKNLTQEEFAKQIGVTAHNVGDWERGKCEPSLYYLKSISEKFNCSADYLIGLNNNICNSDIFNETNGKRLSENLKYLRSIKKVSQKKIASALSISATCYAGYEQNHRSPDIETLILLAKYFNVTTDCLLGTFSLSDNYESLFNSLSSDCQNIVIEVMKHMLIHK